MATQDVFSAEELARLRGFPEINRAELIRCFTLSGADEAFVRQFRTGRNVLGVAVQLCPLPWLGPDEVAAAPAAARARARTETWSRVRHLLSDRRCAELDLLLVPDAYLGWTPLAWLGVGPTSSSPAAVKAELEKLAYLRQLDAHTLDLSMLPAERRRFLAGVGRRLTGQALQRREPERRYPILLTQAITGREAAAKRRMLYETAARAGEILALNIEDLELDARRARFTAKSGATEYVYWASSTAHLLPRLIRGREAGPVFLSERRPGPARRAKAKDLCPHTGRARLGYDRARVLLDRYTSPGQDKPGWELHQLRHSGALVTNVSPDPSGDDQAAAQELTVGLTPGFPARRRAATLAWDRRR